MLFDAPPADLPLATLRRMAPPDRGHLLLGDFDRWLSRRWTWLRPRAVPLAVAFAGLLATLGTVKYAGLWAGGDSDSMALGVHATVVRSPPEELTPAASDPSQPTRIVVRPLGIHDGYIVLTIDPPDAP